MRGKVFIGWTMKEDLAICVKNELRKHDFYGICGGREGSNEILAGIGATVVNQMNKCSSAIMLFSKRDEQIRDVNGNMVLTKTLSPNMLYELGYLSGSLNLKRVMGVYIDGAEDLVPTDIKGGWQETVSTENKTNEELAEEIVKKFLQGQFNLVHGNKMDLMTDISKLRTIIKEHIKKPMYYDDEIAYIVLLLCQASYMHDEMPTDKSLIEELYNADISDKKCLLAINSTIDYFFACDSLVEIEFNGGMQLPSKAYKKLKKNLLEYVDEAEEMDKESFLESLADLHIGEWRKNYDLSRFGYAVLDGTQWHLYIYFSNGHRTVKIHGSNDHPYNFNRLTELFGIDDWEVKGEEE